MEYEGSYEAYNAASRDKLQFLAAVFRIANFGEDIAPGDGDLIPHGQQGYAFGPREDVVVAAIKEDIGYSPDGMYEESGRAHIASLQIGDDIYQFYAVLDRQALKQRVHDTYELHRAIADLAHVDYDRFPGKQRPVEEMIDALCPVSFATQRLEVYKNLTPKAELEISAPHTDKHNDFLAAFALGDFETVRRLSEELFGAEEVDIDELYEIEITQANEVGREEMQELTKLLSEEYFVA